MNVVNLGSYGQPQESPLSGLSDALAQGFQVGAQRQANALREQELAQKNKQDAASNRLERSKYRLELAKYQTQNTKDTLDNEKKALDMAEHTVNLASARAFSLDPDYVNGLTPTPNTNLAMFEQTDTYKNATKLVKKYGAEGFLDEQGKIIYKTEANFAEQKMENFKAAFQQKRQQGLPITQEEGIYFEYASLDPALRGQVAKLVEDDELFLQAQETGNDKAMAERIDAYMQMFKRKTSPLASGLAPQGATDNNDRLGLRNA